MKAGTFKIEVNYTTTISLGVADDDSEKHIRALTGQIVAKGFDSAGDFDIIIGKTRSLYIDLGLRFDSAYDLFNFLDLSQDSVDYCLPLMDIRRNDFSPKLYRLFDNNLTGSNVLALDNLEILPQNRGKRIGLAVLRGAIENFARDCAVVVIRPKPLQFTAAYKKKPRGDDPYKLYMFTGDQKTGTKKLNDYYAQLGFVPYARSELMVLNPRFGIPSLENMGCVNDGYYEISYDYK